MAEKKYNVVIVCEFEHGGHKREQFLKYRNIQPSRLQRFWKWVRGFPDLHHINFYDATKPKGKNFVKQVTRKDIFEGVPSV